jgi:aldehyde oxidoreductase
LNSPNFEVAHQLHVNGKNFPITAPLNSRLSETLRDELGLTGTKVGCHAGDCGACTVLINDQQACACIVPVGQVLGQTITTVEGLADDAIGRALQQAFIDGGAAQCGICTPGMLMAARDLLGKTLVPTESDVADALGGVLCRCTGYRMITAAVLQAAASLNGLSQRTSSVSNKNSSIKAFPVGARVNRFDALSKVLGKEQFGADQVRSNALELSVLRSPMAHARLTIDEPALAQFINDHGLVTVVRASDLKVNAFAIFADMRDQPAIADGIVRFRGEAVLGLVGRKAVIDQIDPSKALAKIIRFEPLPEQLLMDSSLAIGSVVIQEKFKDNVLCRGRVAKAWLVNKGSAGGPNNSLEKTFSASMTTQHVEHAYIEPEAGYASWDAKQKLLTVFACTQTPYMDRDELANMFALEPTQVRIIPSAVGGGFGGKLDLSLQPLIAAATIKTGQPVRCVYQRPESMVSSTKRHPARMSASLSLDVQGNIASYEFEGDFNTGPYASWGPTVANRVPIHACGPYRVPHVLAQTRAVLTHNSVGGAFRGFGVPQSTLINERLIDQAAQSLGKDALDFRYEQAIRAGDTTATGQVLHASVGLQACLAALKPAWLGTKAKVDAFNLTATQSQSSLRRGIGIASMWYGIGNTVIANPSSMRVGLKPTGRVMLYNGAVDIGQGTYTIMPQICAQSLGLDLDHFDQIRADTHLTLDAGKSSASRQTFVSGNAAKFAGQALREKLLALLGVKNDAATLQLSASTLSAEIENSPIASIDLSTLPLDEHGDVAFGLGYFNPPTIALDADGQGVPYATYGFAAQFAELEVDIQLGTVKLLAIHAAHDVGKAINPTQVEGQIHGGIAQGIGLALMEDYHAGKTDNLHDYLIPTIGDIPPITCHLIEDPEPLGPYGAKGVGEPALVATAPAILNAIAYATGVRMNCVPVTPDRLHAAIAAHNAKSEISA